MTGRSGRTDWARGLLWLSWSLLALLLLGVCAMTVYVVSGTY